MTNGWNLEALSQVLSGIEPLPVQGRVLRATGLLVEAALPRVPLGTSCEITAGERRVSAEVVGFSGATALLMPFGEMQGIREGCPVVPRESAAEILVGDGLLGRVVNAALVPIDGGPELALHERVALQAKPPNAMTRRRIAQPFVLGIRAIDGLITMGEGQRLGVMAGPGVGKSVLLGMVAKSAKADIVIVGLVGERGREVREFVERDLGPEGLARSIVVVATADDAPLVRVRAAMSATALAEHYRAKGKKVLLLIDSLSRVAMAQREIGLAAGEPPTAKGYPPSVFAMMPRLLERAGNDEGPGSITGLYTVLAEGDDLTDPVVDAAKSILDGHVVLSRKLAGAGHFPAIDVLQSISRVMSDVASPSQQNIARASREVLATYREAQDLIEVGAYVAGSNPKVDHAIKHIHDINAVLRQAPQERASLQETLEAFAKAAGSKEVVRA